MSLLVWLPLDGDLRNLGASDIQPLLMGTGITYSAGKIGNAATFPNNSNSCIYMPGLKQQIFSWCCWFKCVGEGSGASQRLLSEGRDTGSLGTNIYLSKAGTTLSYSTHKKAWGATIALDTWYHVCLTCDESHIRFYINGELQNTTAYTEDSDYAQSNDCFVIGKMAYSYTNSTNYFPFNGQINDVRIYDHCLSLAEIKEISQGLVVHYNLEGANTNHLQNSNFATGTTTSWHTVNSSSITVTQIDGINVGTGTKGTSNNIIGQTSTLEYTANSLVDISISADVYVKESGTFSTGNWIASTTVAGWQTMSGSRKNHLSLELSPGWNKISTTLRNATQQYSGKVITAFGYTGTTFYITNVKLEVGAKPTNWVPHVNDKLFFTLGYDSSVVEDMSGYGHNGSMIGRIEAMADSPRYKTSLNFPANDSGIEIPSMPMNIFNNGNTVAFWIKPSGEDGQRSVYCGSYSGTSYSIEKRANNKLRIWWAGSPDVSASKLTINDNEWQHIAIVKTEDKQSLLLYKNGEYIETLTNTFPDKEWSGIYRLGRDARTDDTSYIGQMSDFRIYCTPLLDTDIKLLYNTSVKVNKLGGIHSFALEEHASTLLDISLASSASYDKITNTYTFNLSSATGNQQLWRLAVNRAINNHSIECAWGERVIHTFEICASKNVNIIIDYNNFSTDSNITLSGNDNDNVDIRYRGYSNLIANQWKTVTFSYINNNETKNPDHVSLYDASYIYVGAHDDTFTIQVRNPITYIINDDTNAIISKTGELSYNHLIESSLTEQASISKKQRAINAAEFIES